MAAAPLVIAAPALAITPAEAASRSFRQGGAPPKFSITGTYSDPAHEDCTRKISFTGGRSYQIDGADEDGKPWKVQASKAAGGLTVDFTAKGGPAGVFAKQVPGGDIKFPDGNVWKKLS